MRQDIDIVNLTPHPINMSDGTVYPPSGTIARVIETQVGCVAAANVYVFGGIDGLPEPKKGVYYIVSKPTAMLANGRFDVFFPDNIIRNESGTVIGCGCFGRYATDESEFE